MGEQKHKSKIDELVMSKLKKLNIPPSDPCSDEVFIRRVFFDLLGTLPNPKVVHTFIKSVYPLKRSRLINKLLKRDEYADYWSLKWGDILRVKSEFPIKLWPNAVQAYHRWIRTALKNNMPYDKFARELLTSSGSNFRVAPVNFYRAVPKKEPLEIAQTTALTFMGTRIRNWAKKKQMGLAAFFGKVGYKSTAEWKEEIIYFDWNKKFLNPATKKPWKTILPDGKAISIPSDKDPRIVFADWLINKKNPWFAKNIVNRIWCWLFGRGIIHEPDDIRISNPAQNPDLLAYLEKELINHKYDLKHIFKLILNSKTYQLSSEYTKENFKDKTNFSHYYIRRHDAEVLIDAICKITKTRESYSSLIPEPFTFIPDNQRSIKLSDGSITSPFLEKFGRPSRDTGYVSERNNNPSSYQILHLLNSKHIITKLLKSRSSFASGKTDLQKINKIYLTILSRFPTEKEIEITEEYINSGDIKKWDGVFDLAWALINSKEFLFRH